MGANRSAMAAQNPRNDTPGHCAFLRFIASPVRAWEAPLRGDVCEDFGLVFYKPAPRFCTVACRNWIRNGRSFLKERSFVFQQILISLLQWPSEQHEMV